MKLALPLLCAVALSSCATPGFNTGPIRFDGRAMIGQSTQVGRLVATPQAIVEDSRCPINARCIWAGRLIVSTRIDGAGWRETRNLTLGEPQSLRGTSIALVAGDPGKLAGGPPVPPTGYTFAYEGGR